MYVYLNKQYITKKKCQKLSGCLPFHQAGNTARPSSVQITSVLKKTMAPNNQQENCTINFIVSKVIIKRECTIL